MKLEDVRVGQAVVYRPYPTATAPEDGTVTSKNAHCVFVRFSAVGCSKACRAEDLEPQ